jgi:hypothetical protein
MAALKVLGNAMWIVGLLSTIFGLWCAAGGLRAIVSRRIDEREQSGRAAKFAVPFIIAGITLVLGGLWLANWMAAS